MTIICLATLLVSSGKSLNEPAYEMPALDANVSTRLVKDKVLRNEGFRFIPENNGSITIEANTTKGLMYGAYAYNRIIAAGKTIDKVTTDTPAYDIRVLNHWDNLDGTVERGYAGNSIWKWDLIDPSNTKTPIPEQLLEQYRRYARTNAEIGINGVVLNNVNASSKILGKPYLEKVAAIADVLRPYGIKVYLSANFAAPIQLGGLETADPLDKNVVSWWKGKADEIYDLIPDFGGFLVKANSEGQPGPCDYNRTHAQGANMLARALKPHNGIVMWRAFVYSPTDDDRAKQAALEFQPLDGKFDKNVIVQIKNGPIDFQPREPYSPLFSSMVKTPKMVEFQITQEYLGHSNHVVYLGPMWEEFFKQVDPDAICAAAGVANIGDSQNFTANPMAEANWYAFGRLAWNPRLSAEDILQEWLPVYIFNCIDVPDDIYKPLFDSIMQSREAAVNYMMPMGLHHIFAWGHHYGPQPWCEIPGARPDWLPKYYHQADVNGIGFDRTATGSNALSQYPDDFAALISDVDNCPIEYLLWFHHVPWDKEFNYNNMQLSLWDLLCLHYNKGVDMVENLQIAWDKAERYIDFDLYQQVRDYLIIQSRDAAWWRDACLLYFQQFSSMPFPYSKINVKAPVHTLEQVEAVDLGIDNYTCPSADILNKQR